jgi:ABC-2 type transport system permease protein
MSKILAVAGKELRQIRRDPLSLLMLLGLPAFMLVVFGYAVNFDVWNLPIAVEDRDLSSDSRALVAALVNSGRFKLVHDLEAGQDLHRLLQEGRFRAGLIIPDHLARDLAAGRKVSVQLVIDGADSNTANTALGYATGAIETFNAGRLARSLRTAGAEVLLSSAINVQPRVWYNPELRSSHFLVPGLIGFILMITAVLSTALSVVREKERGTMEQLMVAPLGTLQVLLGKTLPYLGISLAATGLILVAARLLFGIVVQGSYVDLFIATAIYLIGGLGFGLLISTIARNQAVAFQMGVFTSMLPTLLLSGFIFPIGNMPLVLQALSYLIPARYYLVVLRGVVLKGTSLVPYWDQVLALILFAGVTILLSAVRFSRSRGIG